MKTLRNTFVLLILSVAFYSCDADATIDEVEQAEFNKTVNAGIGNQKQMEDRRGDDD